jgi:hypothetical protein
MVSPYYANHKDYTHKPPTLLSKKQRVPFMQREKTAIIKLRQHGYSINELSIFSGRSKSVIHRILHSYHNITQTAIANLRTLPNHTRLQSAQKHRLTMTRFMELWMPFILSETDKPP